MQEHFSEIDRQMMARAIDLAKQGRYTTPPNPNVGCVITQGNTVVGEGFHYRAGEPHAEVHALRQAAGKTEGGTAYVTLEPCSHYGRTPPCAQALINAKVAKVICAMQDPNPTVSGNGIRMLRDAGIEVLVGLLESDAEALNPAFIQRMKTQRPFVQLKLAASLDGKTALKNGKSQWITSSAARQDVQKFRALSGAILSTGKTVLDDNASLNVRWEDLPDSVKEQYPESEVRQPLRVILDRNLRLSGNEKLFRCGGEVLVVSDKADASLLVPSSSSGLDLDSVLSKLVSQYQINHVWVEAGATLAASFIEQNLVDELIIYIAPKLMGSEGRGLVNLLGLDSMEQVIDLSITDMRMVGKDIRIRANLNR